MKPYVICHMVASVDGRILTGRWRPEDPERRRYFEPLPGVSCAFPLSAGATVFLSAGLSEFVGIEPQGSVAVETAAAVFLLSIATAIS